MSIQSRGGAVERHRALEVSNLSKSFGTQRVLDDVSFSAEQGDVVALLGENGSGKSTLVKVLSGYHVPAPGSVLRIGGRKVPLPLPLGEFRDVGLSFVFQDLGLAAELTVVENLFVSEWTRRYGPSLRPIPWRAARRRAKAVFAKYGVHLDPGALVSDLSPTEQALLAIVRAAEELTIYRAHSGSSGGVLVLDEPTVFLPETEEVFLFELVHRVAADGTTVLFVSHDFAAIRSVARRALILRDGVLVADVVVADTSDAELVALISGAPYAPQADQPPQPVAQPAQTTEEASRAGSRRLLDGPGPRPDQAGAGRSVVLAVEDLRGGRLHGISFEVHAGETLGIAGLLGSGSESLPYALFGALPGMHGKIEALKWSGDAGRLSPRRAIEAGFALVPADRAQQAVVRTLPVEKNMLSLVLGAYFDKGFLTHGKIREVARQRGATLGLRPADPSVDLASLSGGNQQKVVLAKWMERRPLVLLLHEPTQGVDVGTRAQIYRLVEALAAAGTAIVWVTTDFNELASVSDRILICASGQIAKEMAGNDFTRDEISTQVYAMSTGDALVG